MRYFYSPEWFPRVEKVCGAAWHVFLECISILHLFSASTPSCVGLLGLQSVALVSLAQRPHFLWAPLEASPWAHSPLSAVRPARPRTGEICAALGKFWLHACPGYSPAFGALTSVCLFFKTWIHHQHPLLAWVMQSLLLSAVWAEPASEGIFCVPFLLFHCSHYLRTARPEVDFSSALSRW